MLTVKQSARLNKKLEKEVMADPEGRAAYEAFSLQLDLCIKMKKAREKAHLSQTDVAKKMGTKPPSISRLENNTHPQHSPSIITLMKYAHAIGKKLKIEFVNSNAPSR